MPQPVVFAGNVPVDAKLRVLVLGDGELDMPGPFGRTQLEWAAPPAPDVLRHLLFTVIFVISG
jgi:hypothetical protein